MDVFMPGDPARVSGLVRTTFFDGTTSVLDPASCDERSTGAAEELGYGGNRDLFVVHHEMTHHFVALALRWPASTIVWQAAHGGRRPPGWRKNGWPYGGWDEEHIVNRLLRQLSTSVEDELGIIRTLWGNRVPLVLSHLAAWLRPWTEPPPGDPPEPVRPEEVCFPLARSEDADWRDEL